MIADWLPAETRSRIMRSIRNKDTKPEQVVRRALFAEGYRYRLHAKQLPGKPDIVFHGRRKVVLIHGCFWHQHPSARCKVKGTPASNRGYWTPKLHRNVQRDYENLAALRKLGWKTLIVWECNLRSDPQKAIAKIRTFLGPATNPGRKQQQVLRPR
jgi:DNA mismatch endonuclease (patch repair protein)